MKSVYDRIRTSKSLEMQYKRVAVIIFQQALKVGTHTVAYTVECAAPEGKRAGFNDAAELDAY